jgi:GntR family transcriptional regulator/MocR family aminotransferase
MRRLYSGRRDALVAALRGTLAGLMEVSEPEAGLHLVGWLPPGYDDRAAARAASGLGIDARAIADYSLRRIPRPGLVLGYGAVDERLIREGVQRLAKAITAAARSDA